MSEGELNELSRVIGSLEGRLKGIEDKQGEHNQELRRIRETLTNHRIKMAGIAGGVALAVAYLKNLFHN